MWRVAGVSTRIVEQSLPARSRDLARDRPRRVTGVVGGAFALLAAVLALGADRRIPVAPLVIFVALYALARTIRIRIGPIATNPSLIVLVPAVLLLPATVVPAAVGVALILAGGIDAACGRARQGTIGALASGWGAIGAAAALTAAPLAGSTAARIPVLVVALVWMVAFETFGALAVETLGRGRSVRSVLRKRRGLALADVLLAPVGLAAALGGGGVLGLTLASFSVALLALVAPVRYAPVRDLPVAHR